MPPIPVPGSRDRHLLSRFSYGVTPALVRDARRLGGADAWFRRQLNHSTIDDTYANQFRGWFPKVWGPPTELWRRHMSKNYMGWEVGADLARWTMLRRAYSRRQLHETMVDFWSNHLHVCGDHDTAWLFRMRYDAMIRAHALGRFDKMLFAAVTHPAMALYLTNGSSTADNPNENLGREILELHTVGMASGYDEGSVRQSALLLTGYHIDMRDTWRWTYRPADHWRGGVSIVGFNHPNSQSDGRPAVRDYVNHLARHPATAQRIARKLAVHFVRDAPPQDLVDDVARVFRNSGTDIKATLRALVSHPAFNDAVGAKVRTPIEDAAATYRVMGVRPHRPRTRESFANGVLQQASSMGQRPFGWPRPDGFPDVAEAWTGVSRVLNSFQVHKNVIGGFGYPRDAAYRNPQSFLPRLPASLGEVVDHASRQLLARPATPSLRSSVSARLELPMSYRVRDRSDMEDWRMVPLLHTVLNTPAHMSR